MYYAIVHHLQRHIDWFHGPENPLCCLLALPLLRHWKLLSFFCLPRSAFSMNVTELESYAGSFFRLALSFNDMHLSLLRGLS